MAFTVNTVGTLGSGANYAASVGALQAWEDFYDSVGLEQRASLITDIVDDVLLQTWPSGSVIEIVSSEEGSQRKITQQSSGGHGIQIDDEDLTDVTINDIYFECENQASSKHAVYVSLGGDTLELNRVRLSNCTSDGLNLAAGSSVTTATLNNCIADDNGGVGFNSLATSCTLTYSNCGSYSNTSHGFGSANDATAISILQNCIAMDNSGEDFRDEATGVTRLYNCVSEDATANDANHDVKDGVAYSQSSTGVFLDLAGGNFSRTKSDTDAFSITGSASLTPATDYYSVTRKNDTIGPFDFILGRQTHRKSLEFAGGYADLGSTLFAGLTAWTITGWVKWNANTVNTSPFFGNIATYNCAPSIRLHATTGSLKCIAGNGSANIVNMYTTGTPIFVGVWHHLAFSYDGTDAVLYVDGVAQAMTEASSTLASQALHSSDTLRIGGGQSGSSAAFPGHQLDARIYNRAITAAEASNLADATKTTSTALDTLAHYKLESGHPTICFDSSGNENHGTLSGSVTTDVESPVPFSFANEVGYSSTLSFDGSADYLTFPAAIKTTMSMANDWSLHLDYIVGATTGILFGSMNGATTDRFALGNGLRFSVQDATGQIDASVGGSTATGNRDRWVATWEASGRNLKIWRDGVANTGTLAANLPGSSGTWAMSSAGGSLFDSGEIIKMQVFSTNLSDAEALALSSGTAPATAPYATWNFEDGVGSVISDSIASSHGSAISSPIWVVVPRDESDPTKDVRGDLLDYVPLTAADLRMNPPINRLVNALVNRSIG